MSTVSQGSGGGNDGKGSYQHPDQTVPIHEDERKHGWDALSDDRKKQLEVRDATASHDRARAHHGSARSEGVSWLESPPLVPDTLHTANTRRARKRYARRVPSGWCRSRSAWRAQKKAHLWSLQNWLHDAEQRTRDYYDGRARSPVTWILVDGKNIPTNIAIPGGEEHGEPHYICRGFHEVSRS